jgi:hypothetical protein
VHKPKSLETLAQDLRIEISSRIRKIDLKNLHTFSFEVGNSTIQENKIQDESYLFEEWKDSFQKSL